MKQNFLNKWTFPVLIAGALVSKNVMATPGLTFMKETPSSTIDFGRSVVAIITGIINLCSDGENKAELIATQDEINKNADGTCDGSANAAVQYQITQHDINVKDSEFTSRSYGYVNSKIWKTTPVYVYDVLANALGDKPSVATARNAVISTFFADGDKKDDMTYQEQIRSQRQEYAQLVSRRHVNIGYEIQQRVVLDLQAAGSAPVTMDNEVGAMSIDAYTLDEMIKATLVDLTLQIELMEADALTFMLHQPVKMLDSV